MADFDKDVLRIMKNIQSLQISPKDKRLLNTIHQFALSTQLDQFRIRKSDAKERRLEGHEATAVNFQLDARRKGEKGIPGPAFLLVQAAGMDNEPLFRQLLAECPNVDAQPPGWDGWTALHSAVANGHIANARALREHSASLNANIQCHYIGWTALHYAVDFCRVEMVEFLCKRCGANIFVRDWMGSTAEELGLRNRREARASLEKAERFLESVDATYVSKGVGAGMPSPPKAEDHILGLLRRLRVTSLSRCLLLVMAHLHDKLRVRRECTGRIKNRTMLIRRCRGLERTFVKTIVQFLN